MTHLRLTLVAAAAVSLAACNSSHTNATDDVNAAVFIATSDSLLEPLPPRAGYVTVRFDNDSDSLMAHVLVRLATGVSPDSGIRAARVFHGIDRGDPKVALRAFDGFYGGAVFVAPRSSRSVGVMLPAGHYIAYADVVSGDQPRVHPGFITAMDVRPDPVVEAPPAPRLTIQMKDFAFDGPTSISAGKTRWRVENTGSTEHLLFLARILPGHTYAEAESWIRNPEGAAPIADTETLVGVHALSHGVFNDVDLDLARGDYVVVCFIEGHHLMGMVSPLHVR